ncbi:MAG: hypothetical protein WCZ72_06980 [Gemmobacter sp.]
MQIGENEKPPAMAIVSWAEHTRVSMIRIFAILQFADFILSNFCKYAASRFASPA